MGVQLATDLPVFNRNQGNIAIAKAMEKQSQVGYNSVQNAIVNEVVSEINHYSEVMKLMNVDLSAYDKEISTIQMNAAKAFAERQINMVDFIDKLRSTLLAKNNNLELKQNYINTAISINQATETNIFPIK
jgi:cobalt-zinc-cadmium efflux system outer membrane protein